MTTEIRILFNNNDGWAAVPALHIQGCWAVHKKYGSKTPDAQGQTRPGFIVTHVPTGLGVAATSTETRATELCNALPQVALQATFGDARRLLIHIHDLKKHIPAEMRI